METINVNERFLAQLHFSNMALLPSISTLLFINCSEFNFVKIVCHRIPNAILNVIYKDAHVLSAKMTSKPVIKTGFTHRYKQNNFFAIVRSNFVI